MNITWYFVERFSEIATIVLSLFFLYRVMDVKANRKAQILGAVALIVVRMLYYYSGLGYRPYFSVLVTTVYACFIFEGKLRKQAVWNILAVVIDGIIDITVVSSYLLISNTSIEAISVPGVERTIVVIVAKVLLLFAYILVTTKVDKNRKMNNEDFLLILLIPIGCWTLLEVLFNRSDTLAMASNASLTEISIALLIILISVVILHNRIILNEKELTRVNLQLHMSEMTEDHIAQIKLLHTQLSSIKHDLHNHFSAILGYVNASEYDELAGYIKHLTDLDVDILEHTSNNVLNVLISTRKSLAIEQQIEFTTNIIFPEVMPVNDVDLCILVSNILDNAFDASRMAHEPRYINLNTRVVDSYWVIACRNSVQNIGRLRTSNNIESSKDFPELHGIGTKQIKDIAEKTGGFVTYKHENHEFSTLVMIKLSAENINAHS